MVEWEREGNAWNRKMPRDSRTDFQFLLGTTRPNQIRYMPCLYLIIVLFVYHSPRGRFCFSDGTEFSADFITVCLLALAAGKWRCAVKKKVKWRWWRCCLLPEGRLVAKLTYHNPTPVVALEKTVLSLGSQPQRVKLQRKRPGFICIFDKHE